MANAWSTIARMPHPSGKSMNDSLASAARVTSPALARECDAGHTSTRCCCASVRMLRPACLTWEGQQRQVQRPAEHLAAKLGRPAGKRPQPHDNPRMLLVESPQQSG